jgi:DNA-binding transcriptional MocR family regulator
MEPTGRKRIEKTHLYRQVAERVVTLVENGTLRPGDRVPSIRELSRQARVSINTIKTAYGYLEDRCMIEARPQSGYYVCARLPDIPKEPKPATHRISPLEISSSELVVRINRDVMNPGKVQFGAAIPNPALIPAQKLARSLGAETRRSFAESAEYSVPPGNRRLRTQIARRMVKAGCVLNPDEIIITTGASEAVFLALGTLCKPGDTVAISSPIYFNFVQMLKILHLRVIEIPNSPTEGLHIETLRNALEHNRIACCLVVSNFDNPMGSSLSDAKKQELVSVLAEAGVPLLEDDINGDLCHMDERPTVAKAWDQNDTVLLCSSFSKTIAPGYRVGWISPGRYFEEVLHRKLICNIASTSPTQMGVAEFLENGGYEHHLRAIRKLYAEKVARMAEAIGSYFPAGTRVTRPRGGFTLWLELPEGIDTLRLYARAAEQDISIAPGALFSTRNDYTNCLRLNGAFWSEENRWAVQALGRIAHTLQ